MSSEIKKTKEKSKNYFFILCFLVLAFTVFLRLISLSLSPLFDTTETRYASIAQEIILHQDWITPRLPFFDEPFLGKPPLSFWLIATSYKFFGSNEFAARFPNFLESLLTLLFTFLIGRKLYDKRTAILSTLVLNSCIFFFIQAGTVSLDMMVCLTLTGSIWAYLSILKAKEQKQPWQKFLYEISLGIFFGLGMLNKGPLSIVLFLGVLFIHGISQGWNKTIKYAFAVNWIIVFVIGIVLAIPWYLAVQKANPDFLSYFFLQENFGRYLIKNYGDRYGNGHVKPHGMSWLFGLGAFIPWSFFLLPFLFALWKQYFAPSLSQDSSFKPFEIIKTLFTRLNNLPFRVSFILSWAIFSPLFFTMARSILMTYLVGTLPALAILCGRFLSITIHNFKTGKYSNDDIVSSHFILNILFNHSLSLVYIVLSVLVIAMGAISYSAGFPYQMPRPLIMTCAITVIIIAFGIGFVARERSQRIFCLLVLVAAIGIPSIMAFWYGPLSTSIGENKSMKAVLQDIKTKLPDYASKHVSFWGDDIPYSWYFYTQSTLVSQCFKTCSHKSISHSCHLPESTEKIVKASNSLIVVTKSHLDSIRLKYPHLYAHGLIAQDGKYYVFQTANY